MSKKRWYARIASLFLTPRTTNNTTTRNTSSTSVRSTPHPTNHTTSRTISRTTSRINTHSTPYSTNRTITRSTQKKYTQSISGSKSVQRPSVTRNSVATTKKYVLNRIRPRASVLCKEDFKCIFCFQLPKLPADEKRGIILCPHCKHPAHIDEFKDWLKKSTLCSRCDRPISTNFIRNAEIIPAIVYLKAMDVLMKNGR